MLNISFEVQSVASLRFVLICVFIHGDPLNCCSGI